MDWKNKRRNDGETSLGVGGGSAPMKFPDFLYFRLIKKTLKKGAKFLLD